MVPPEYCEKSTFVKSTSSASFPLLALFDESLETSDTAACFDFLFLAFFAESLAASDNACFALLKKIEKTSMTFET